MNRPPSGTLMDPLIHLIAAESSTAAKSSFRGAGQVPGLLRCGAAKLAQPRRRAAAVAGTSCRLAEANRAARGARFPRAVSTRCAQVPAAGSMFTGVSLEFGASLS